MTVDFRMFLRNCEETPVEPPLPPKTAIWLFLAKINWIIRDLLLFFKKCPYLALRDTPRTRVVYFLLPDNVLHSLTAHILSTFLQSFTQVRIRTQVQGSLTLKKNRLLLLIKVFGIIPSFARRELNNLLEENKDLKSVHSLFLTLARSFNLFYTLS